MSRRTVAISLAFILVLAGGVWIGRHSGHDARPEAAGPAVSKDVYQCSMHPQIVSDKPGTCPICHMQLTKVERHEGEERPARDRKVLFYRHPMDPQVTSTEPAKDEMGMDYVPVYEDEQEGAAGADVPGHAAFTLSTERQQMIGVKTALVERKPLNMEIRTVGQVAYDPELYNAIGEYREAAASRRKLGKSASAETKESVQALVRAATLRLRLMGLSDAQIEDMAQQDLNPVNLLLPGKNVWIYAQIYESEADAVKPGQTAVITLPSGREGRYSGKIVAIDPVLNAATRTLRARIRVETPEARLKPEAFVNVRILVPLGRALAVPDDAVLDTGEHQIVFVRKEQGRFEPRSVDLGRAAEGHYEVLKGLAEGERVVTSANFLIDSESRFKAAIAAFKSAESSPAAGHAH